jgi:hypothetical protein
MGFFNKKKKGVVEYERPISYFLDSNNDMFFKGKDFHKFLVEYQKEFEKRGLTPKNNDASKLLEMFIDNFNLFAENENNIKNNLSN